MMFKQANPVALITGASRGLGRTLAGFLAAQGYALVLTARNSEVLEAVAQELRTRFGVTALAIAGDVTDGKHRQALAGAAAGLGRLDLLVNNASRLGPSPQPALVDYPLETLEEVLRTNVIAPLALVQETRALLAQSHGLVVNVSSDAAVGAYEGWGGYGASKAALDLISATLARELQTDGISVVAVDPGDMRTQMHQEAYPGEDISDRPEPDVTTPFWAWLLGQEAASVNGSRFQAQAEMWEVAS